MGGGKSPSGRILGLGQVPQQKFPKTPQSENQQTLVLGQDSNFNPLHCEQKDHTFLYKKEC